MSKIYAVNNTIVDDRNHVDRPAHLPRKFVCENPYAMMRLIEDLTGKAEDWEMEYDHQRKQVGGLVLELSDWIAEAEFGKSAAPLEALSSIRDRLVEFADE